MITRPIILIEDDIDDKNFFEEAFKDVDIPNPLLCFDNCNDALTHIKNSAEIPFLILCDINLPKQSGLELKRYIDKDEKLKSKIIPFVFYTTTSNRDYINEAYKELTVQGFFQKSHDFEETKKDIKLIVDYWAKCLHPNSKTLYV
ncbi:response regulator [Emticicia agri]|uniref:Response regulator n=1 Tax=Emticicia agri TaxID=2492393 RepID=A0A4Q5LWF5_9BACT|nr:response regulator [Emticicia agri]RYU94116.1 response regulator [Emticicia agri]